MASASTSSGTLSTLRIPSSRSSRRIADGDSTAARSSIARTAPRRSTSPAESRAIGIVPAGIARARRVPRDQLGLAAGEVEQHDGAAVARHHPAHAAERRASDLGRRARRQNRLVEVVQHRQPLGRAPEPLLGSLALGDVGDHADRAHRRPVPAGDGARRDQSPDFGAVLAAEAEVVALAARAGGAERALRAGPRRGVEEVVHRPPQQGAVLVAQQVGHPLVDVGDDPAVVGDPDPLLGHVDQLLEALLALLQRLGALLEPALPRLEGRGVLERGADEAAEQPERLRVAVAEGRRGRARAP